MLGGGFVHVRSVRVASRQVAWTRHFFVCVFSGVFPSSSAFFSVLADG